MSYNHSNYYQQARPNGYYYPPPPLPQSYSYPQHYPHLSPQQQSLYPPPPLPQQHPHGYSINYSNQRAPPPTQYKTPIATRSLLLNLPSELLDQILASRILTIADYLALAATNKALRCCFSSPPESTSSPLWSALIKIRPFDPSGEIDFNITEKREEKRLIEKIWSGKIEMRKLQVLKEYSIVRTSNYFIGDEDNFNTSTRLNENGKRVMQEHDEEKVWKAVRSNEWDLAIGLVNDEEIGKTDAKKRFKLNDKQMATLKFQRGTSNRMWYRTVAVHSLAFELHGGFFGHQEWLKKSATRSANRKRRPRTHGWFPIGSTTNSTSRAGSLSASTSTEEEEDYEDQLAFKQAYRDRMDELYEETDDLNYASAQAIKEVREMWWGK